MYKYIFLLFIPILITGYSGCNAPKNSNPLVGQWEDYFIVDYHGAITTGMHNYRPFRSHLSFTTDSITVTISDYSPYSTEVPTVHRGSYTIESDSVFSVIYKTYYNPREKFYGYRIAKDTLYILYTNEKRGESFYQINPSIFWFFEPDDPGNSVEIFKRSNNFVRVKK